MPSQDVRLSVRLPVCLSVRLSHASIESKRLYISSKFFHHRVAPPLNYFYVVRISISLVILSEIFIQIGYFSESYARKQKWVFFLNTVYMNVRLNLRPVYSDATQLNSTSSWVELCRNKRALTVHGRTSSRLRVRKWIFKSSIYKKICSENHSKHTRPGNWNIVICTWS